MSGKGQRRLEPGVVEVGGAPEGYDATLLAEYAARTGGPVLHVARDDRRAAAMADALAVVAPGLAVIRFPAWDCLPYDRVSPNPEISAARMAALSRLADGAEAASVVLTTVNAAIQRVPSRAVVRRSSFAAQVGRRVDLDALLGFLARMGFNRAPTVTEPGDFAVRGGIVDIFPPGADLPVRLDFFGDTVEGVRRFEAATQRTVEKIDGIELAPAGEVILDPDSIARFRTRYRETFGAAGLDDALYASVSAGRKHQGMEHWAPFFHDGMETLFDYLPGAPVTMEQPAGDDPRPLRRAQVHRRRRDGLQALRARTSVSRRGRLGRRARRPRGAPLRREPPPAGAGDHRRRRPHRAQLRARAPAGRGEPVRRAGRACRDAGPRRRGGAGELVRGRARPARDAAGRPRREGREADGRLGRGRQGRLGRLADGLAAGSGVRERPADGHLGTGRAGRPADPGGDEEEARRQLPDRGV
jgi:transcription-repair coupling factor (superfamily II helicase)